MAVILYQDKTRGNLLESLNQLFHIIKKIKLIIQHQILT
jgi:hypothetical protein